MAKVAINGFGRIGRLTYRFLLDKKGVDVVAINDLTDAKTLAHLFKYDSVHGQFPGTVSVDGDNLVVNGKSIKIYAERDPENLPWSELGVDIVVEATGVFRDREKMGKHIKAGAKKVVLTVPADKAEDVDATVVLGVNDHVITKDLQFISNASCTTNCLAPFAKVLNDKFGIKRGLMNTIHSYTNDQIILDAPHKDLRRARAAAMSIIPTSTGAAKAVGLVIPELKGKLTGMSFRVPTLDVSVVDLTCRLEKETTYDEIKAVMKHASENELKGILGYTEDAVVSSDFIGDPRTSIFDAGAGIMLNPNFVKVVAWYDNEMGYSYKIVEFIVYMNSTK